jgi:hypothetical protein
MHPQLAIGFGAHSHDKLAEEWTRRRKRRRRRRNCALGIHNLAMIHACNPQQMCE